MGLGYLFFIYGLKCIIVIEIFLIIMLEFLFNFIWVVIGYGECFSILVIFGGLIIVLVLVGWIIVLC